MRRGEAGAGSVRASARQEVRKILCGAHERATRRATFLLTLVFLTGCATSYGPYGFWRGGGYTDQRLPDGTYLVTVRFTSAMDDHARAFEFFQRRASEIAAAEGCKTYEVLEMQGGSQTGAVVPVGGIFVPVEYPSASGRIRCVRE